MVSGTNCLLKPHAKCFLTRLSGRTCVLTLRADCFLIRPARAGRPQSRSPRRSDVGCDYPAGSFAYPFASEPVDESSIRMLRLTGLVGTVALAVLATMDLIMLFSPLSDPVARTSSIGAPRLLVGGLGGVLAIPLVLPGLWHICLALRPAGRWFAVSTAALGAYAYVLGAAFHYAVMLLAGLGYPLARASVLTGTAKLPDAALPPPRGELLHNRRAIRPRPLAHDRPSAHALPPMDGRRHAAADCCALSGAHRCRAVLDRGRSPPCRLQPRDAALPRLLHSASLAWGAGSSQRVRSHLTVIGSTGGATVHQENTPGHDCSADLVTLWRDPETALHGLREKERPSR